MINEQVYRELQKIVGPEFVSNAPEICKAYGLKGRGFHNAEARLLGTTPACVVLPGSSREVREIVLLAKRHLIPFTPASTFWFTQAGPRHKEVLFIDLKRLNRLDIDPKNMTATLGPGVIYAQLQAEALKHGLFTMVPGGGSQASVVANHLSWGFSPLNYRLGMANRRIMGVEWVLPDGSILKLGSLATGQNPFWGEGPGPDLRGLLRGNIGWMGSLGIVTKMCVRLFPFQPRPLKPKGITPETYLEFPADRIKWYNFLCPSMDSLVEMMRDIGQAEIGAAVMRVPKAWYHIAKATSKEDLWKRLSSEKHDTGKAHQKKYLLRVLLIGFTSERQLQYEEKVLLTIAERHAAEQRPAKQRDQSWIQSADSVSMWWPTGAFMSVTGQVDSIDCALKTSSRLCQLKKKYTPPTMDDNGDPGWFQLNDMGHCGYLEFLNYWDPNDHQDMIEKIDEYYHLVAPKELVRCGALSFFLQTNSPLSLDGPNYGPNYHRLARKIKQLLDPQGLSNPPGILDALDHVIHEAPWLEKLKDWE